MIEAMLRDPASQEAAEAVRGAAQQVGAFDAYAEAFAARGRALARQDDVAGAVDSLAEAALVYEEELEDLCEAAKLWEDVLRLQGDHRRALFTLGLLLHDLDRWDDLIDLYRRRLASSTDAGERTTLHLYIAELLSERKNDDAAAFDEVLRAARLMPSNLRIISRVQHLGERTERLEEVAVMIGDLLVQQDDPKLRAALSLRLAELNLGPLGDDERALAYLRAALMDDGENPEILSEIEDVFRERHRFDALAEVLEEAATDRRVGPHRVRLERELARIYEKELADLPRALSALGRAIRQTPEDRELLDEILRLGTAADRLDIVAEAYEHVVSSTDNPLLRTFIRLKLGYLYADNLGRLDAAARVFSAILDAEPGHEEARKRLMRIREKLPDDQDAEAAASAASEDPAQASPSTADGDAVDPSEDRTEATSSEQTADALDASTAEGASRDDAGDAGAAGSTAAAGTAGSDASEAPSHASTDASAASGEVTDTSHESAADGSTADRSGAADDSVADGNSAAGDSTASGGASSSTDGSAASSDSEADGSNASGGASADGTTTPGRSSTDSTTASGGSTADSSTAYGESAADASGAVARPAADGASTPDASDADGQRGSDASVAAKASADPAAPIAAEDPSASDDATASGSVSDAEGAASLASPVDAPDAEVAADDPSAGSKASEDDDGATRVGGDGADPLARVEKSAVFAGATDEPTEFDGQGFGPESETVLSADARSSEVQAASPADAEDKEEVLIGPPASSEEVLEVETSDVEAADIDIDIEVSVDIAQNDAAEPRLIVEGTPVQVEDGLVVVGSSSGSLSVTDLAAAVGGDGPSSPMPTRRPTPPLSGADDLTTYTTIAGPVRVEHQGLLERFEVLQRDVSDAIETNDVVRIIHRLASVIEIFEELRQLDRAFLASAKLAEVAPRDDHLQEVLRLGRSAEAHALMFATIERIAAGMGPDKEIHFGVLMADIEIEDLRSLPAAMNRFERLAERYPENEVLLGRWLTVLDKQDQPEAMADLLVRRSMREDDARLAFPFVQRAMALLDERLSARQRATDVLYDFVERCDYPVARDQLEARMLDEGRYEELIGLLSEGIEGADAEVRVSKYLQLAELYTSGLGQPDEAEALLNRGLDEQPGSIDLLAGLMRLAEAQGRWREVLSFGQRQLDNAEDANMRTALRRRLAHIAEAEADDSQLAQELLATAIDEHPQDIELLDQLLRLQMAEHQWSGALETLRLKWAASDAAQARAQVALQRAAILGDQYQDIPAALDAVRDALELVPDHPEAMARMVELSEAAGEVDEAVRVLEHWAAVSEGPAVAEVHVHRGRLLESAFGDPAGAARAYEAALLADVNHVDARRSLLRMAEVQGDYVRALSLAIEAAERSEDPRDASLSWQHAGRLAQAGVGDDLEALRCYERALAQDPEDLATAATVGELLLARRSFAEAYPHLDRAARGLSDPDRSADLYAAAATAAHHLEMPEAAMRAYESVLELRPDDRVALDRLGAYLEKQGEWGRVHDLGAHLLLRHEDALAPTERAQVYLRMARAKLAEDDTEAAVRLARRADGLHETEEVLEVLADALDRAGQPFEAADCFKRLAPMRGDDRSRRETLMRAAKLLGEDGVDLARAAALAAEAQALVPADVEVAELLSEYRRNLGDARLAGTALWVPSQHIEGRPKADLLVRAARILIEGDVARHQARRWLTQAVTIVPTHAEALDDLRVILAFDGEYATLAQVQARAADSFLEDPETEVDAGEKGRTATAEELLRSNLDLYRFRLDSPKRALTCCQRLQALYPDDVVLEEVRAHLLAELVRRRPEPQLLDEAVRAWSQALERRPGDPELIQQVADLRKNAGQARATALLAELSAALGLRSPTIEPPSITEDATVPRLSIKPSAQESDSAAQTWLDRLGYAPLVAFSDALPEPRPRKRDLQAFTSLGEDVRRPLGYASARLGMAPPPVYLREDLDVPVRPTWVGHAPALLMAPDFGDIYEPAVVRFLLGRSLGQLRGRALALAVIPLNVLREGLLGFAKVTDPVAYLADPRNTKKRGRALERAVPAAERMSLTAALSAWFDDPKRRSLAEERDAVLRTADRAGLMVSGSLTAALQGLQVLSDGRTERTWRVPLLEYAASQACAELMERLD